MNWIPEAISKYFILYEIDGRLFQECNIPLLTGSKKNTRVVKVKPVGQGKEECRERYWLCRFAADSFPIYLDGMQGIEDLLSLQWRPANIERIFEYGNELTATAGSACYISRIADDDLGYFEYCLESFMEKDPSAEEIATFVQLCDQSELERLSVFCNMISYNVTELRKKNYWKWCLYRRTDNPYNKR